MQSLGTIARLAQSVERWTLNPTVVGSSPTLGEFSFYMPLQYKNILIKLLYLPVITRIVFYLKFHIL